MAPDGPFLEEEEEPSKGKGRKRKRPRFICIEDEKFRWNSKTITTEEIAELGGWDPSEGVIEVDKDQNERTLEPGEVIKVRPGVAFGKKFCFKRGA